MDGSKSGFLGASVMNQTTPNLSRTAKGIDDERDKSRRHVERLLLRLDFNGELLRPRREQTDILAEGGLAV